MEPKNKDALAFFRAHPDAKYWYSSSTLRVPNPRFFNRPDYKADPWP
jgi:hypothetical protein